MQIIKGKKKIRGVIYLLLCLLTVFVCWLFVGRNGVFEIGRASCRERVLLAV